MPTPLFDYVLSPFPEMMFAENQNNVHFPHHYISVLKNSTQEMFVEWISEQMSSKMEEMVIEELSSECEFPC